MRRDSHWKTDELVLTWAVFVPYGDFVRAVVILRSGKHLAFRGACASGGERIVHTVES